MWAGTLAFGLVDIPVRLGPATRPRELAFRQVHAEDGGRITFRRSCTACGADVPYADVAKAYQRPGGDLVPLTDADLASLPLETSRRIDVLCFISPGALDPLLVSRSYLLVPDAPPGPDPGLAPVPGAAPGLNGARAFDLFRTALARSGRVAVAKITLRQREARAAVWARGPALVLQTLLTPDELAEPIGPALATPAVPANDHTDLDLSLAGDLIAAMSGEFDPAAHHDRYRDQLEALIHRKTTADPADPADPTHPADRTHPADPQNIISNTNHRRHGSTGDLTTLLRASLATPAS
jgi:DNA end-binding protein Ku